MKKRILSLLGAAVLSISLLAGCARETDEKAADAESTPSEETEQKKLAEVTLNEVAHSIFYAPMYAAIEEGYFEEEGIDLTLVCGFGDNILGRDNGVKMIQYPTPEPRPRGIVMLYSIQITAAGTGLPQS